MSIIKKMFEAGIHFGHQTRYWHPKMNDFIFCKKNKTHIINLEKTAVKYKLATKFIQKIVENNGKILFIGTKRSSRKIIEEEAIKSKQPFISTRWLGGTLTNFKTVKDSIKKLKEMIKIIESNNNNLTKKENLLFNKKLFKLNKIIGGIKDMEKLPDAIFVVDVGHHKIAVNEAKKLKIPILGVVDTNHSPEGIDYIIPGNDDSFKSISFYVKGISSTILNIKKKINNFNI